MERIVDTQAWEKALSKAKSLSVKGLEKAEFALMYAHTLLTQGKTLVQKVVALKKYFLSNCDINYNWLLYIRLPEKKVKPRNSCFRLVAIPSFKRN